MIEATEDHVEATTSTVVNYEEHLRKNPRWALNEGGKFFEGDSKVQMALTKIAHRLNDLGIPYAIVGGMALSHHGFTRFTNDVDILVTRDSNALIHEKLEGLGYLPPFEKSKHLRDTELGVKVEFLITGDYPGDGKPKPVSFPDPASVREFNDDGISFLKLVSLIELKLASGMTNPNRLKDLADVQELIKAINLPLAFSEQLHEYVRPKFVEFWNGIHSSKDPFEQ